MGKTIWDNLYLWILVLILIVVGLFFSSVFPVGEFKASKSTGSDSMDRGLTSDQSSGLASAEVTVSLNGPSDGATEVSVPPLLNATVSSSLDNPMDVSFYQKYDAPIFQRTLSYGETIFDSYADNNYIYVGGDGDKIKIYYKSNMTLNTNLTTPKAWIESIYVDDDYIYAGSASPEVYVFNKTDFSLKKTFDEPSHYLFAIHADDKYIYAGDYYGRTWVYNRSSLELIQSVSQSGSFDGIYSIDSDENYIYAGSRNNNVQVYSKVDFSFDRDLTGADDAVRSIYVDNNYIYAGGRDKKVQIYNKDDFTLETELTEASETIESIYADNEYIYVGSRDNKARVYDIDDFTLKTELTENRDGIYSIHADGSRVYTGGSSGELYVYSKRGLLNTIESVSDGSSVSYEWSETSKETEYNWFVEVSDGTDSVFSDVWSFETESFIIDLGIEKNDSFLIQGLDSISIDWYSNAQNLDDTLFNITYPDGSLLLRKKKKNGQITLNPENLTQSGNYTINLWANNTGGDSRYMSEQFEVIPTVGLNECQVIDSKGFFYLTKNLSSNLVNCFDIQVDNVVLDCQNYEINGNGQGSNGISVNGFGNISIKNCAIKNWTGNGIYFKRVTGGSIYNNKIGPNEENAGGMYIRDGSENQIIANEVIEAGSTGIEIYYSQDNEVRDNIVKENSRFDIYFYTDSLDQCNNIILNNTGSGDMPILYYKNEPVYLEDQIFSSLILCNADNSYIDNITIVGSETLDNNGIHVHYTDNSVITNSKSLNNFLGVSLSDSNNNNITHNLFKYNSRGISVFGNNNKIYNNTASSNSRGISVSYDNNEVIDNIVNLNNWGIYAGSSSGATISNNIANANSQFGIRFTQYANNNVMNSNIFCNKNPSEGYEDIENEGSNSGDNNTCDISPNYNDEGETGCTETCTDTNPPEFTKIPDSKQITYGEDWGGVDFDAVDDMSVIDSWWIDNENFTIDDSGYLDDSVILPVGKKEINIFVNDTSGNTNSIKYEMFVSSINVSLSSILSPLEYGVDSTYVNWSVTDQFYDIQGVVFNISYSDEEIFVRESDETGSVYLTPDNLTKKGEYTVSLWAINDEGENISFETTFSVIDTVNPKINTPSDPTIEYWYESVRIDYNASDHSEIFWSVNDTDNFKIDSDGILINKTGLEKAIYKVKVSATDTEGNTNSNIINIRVIDTRPPQFTNLENHTLPPNQELNYDIDGSDPSGIDSWWIDDFLNFSINSSTGLLINNKNLSIGEEYKLNVSVNDTLGLVNSNKISIKVRDVPYFVGVNNNQSVREDRTGGWSYQFEVSSISNVSAFSLSGPENENFDINSDGVMTINLLEVGEYSVNVTVNNTAGFESAVLFNLEITKKPKNNNPGNPGGGSPSGLGSPSGFWTKTQLVRKEQFNNGYSQPMDIGERFKVKVNGSYHHIGVVELSADSALINVSSDTQQVEMSVGDLEKFELNNDSYYDLSVYLVSIMDEKANITIQSLHELIDSVDKRQQSEGENKTAETVNTTEDSNLNKTNIDVDERSDGGLWILLGIILIIVFFILFIFWKRRRNNIYIKSLSE